MANKDIPDYDIIYQDNNNDSENNPDPNETAAEIIEYRQKIIQIKPLMMPIVHENIESIQNGFNVLITYLNFELFVKLEKILKLTSKLSNKILYEDIMSNFGKYDINARNYSKMSELIFKYYYSLLDNIENIVPILINVNYTHNKTNISLLICGVVNNLAINMLRRFLKAQVTKPNEEMNVPIRFQSKVHINQNILTKKINHVLSRIHNNVYYKYTNDNDVNNIKTLKVKKENMIDHIKVVVIVQKTTLNFNNVIN
ncbi:Adho45-like protein [Cryptophlebia peltastica nucleopolyhedrovirus]|uniref:Adho45-like protein n=1 Tax=Cryptophlebia peltastica nucleopolyhedrovirus TaxID=2304025 RepID=A0A346RNQ7_9ABAC|nr:Adho45-like protein [Cryptophlebia peltastica nucleopolyhedrovirus]AXS67704.1 Adho45-like protein [Cryptophlebia peltastica nucleopolyhedrovirus]